MFRKAQMEDDDDALYDECDELHEYERRMYKGNLLTSIFRKNIQN